MERRYEISEIRDLSPVREPFIRVCRAAGSFGHAATPKDPSKRAAPISSEVLALLSGIGGRECGALAAHGFGKIRINSNRFNVARIVTVLVQPASRKLNPSICRRWASTSVHLRRYGKWEFSTKPKITISRNGEKFRISVGFTESRNDRGFPSPLIDGTYPGVRLPATAGRRYFPVAYVSVCRNAISWPREAAVNFATIRPGAILCKPALEFQQAGRGKAAARREDIRLTAGERIYYNEFK